MSSIKRIALIVTTGTIISKLGGMARQLAIASIFGIGAAYDAYNYAYVIPGFFLILLGGINGPFHNSMVTVLSRRSQSEGKYILSSINTIISFVLIITSTVMAIAANPLINLVGPGLSTETHQIAVIQLQIMSPLALFAGLIGLGFGSLNARNEFLIPSISPLISSLTLVSFVLAFAIFEPTNINSYDWMLKGGCVLAIATLIGAILQWGVQLPALIKKGLISKRINWDFNHPGVREVLSVIGPATLSSGMLQINVFTDLFFASDIVGAASGLGYANFLVQAPLGLYSSALIIPLLPIFAKLSNPKKQKDLIEKIGQSLMISSAGMIALGSIFISLCGPIVSLVYERGAFNANAVQMVRGLLLAYGIGMPFYLGRDLLVRIFYALGNAKIPFRVSILGIVLNIFFDWLLVGAPSPWGRQLPFNLGAQGLVLATVAVNFLSCLILLYKLHQKVGGLPVKQWSFGFLKLLLAGFTAGILAFGLSSTIYWGKGFVGLISQVSIISLIAITAFGLVGKALGIDEIIVLIRHLRRKIIPF